VTPPRQIPSDTPARITVIAWPDPVIEAHGHRPGSAYIEAVWLGRLGPSTTLAWQRMARIASAHRETVIDSVDLATSLGLGQGLGRNAPISRTLARMVAFGVAVRSGDTLAVRLALPDLPAHQAARLSASARIAHDRWARIGYPVPPAAGTGPAVEVGL
jgi:hypothetical protein